MPRYMCSHTLGPNAVTPEQCAQIGQAAQQDPIVHGQHSYMNLSEGHVMCIFDAPDKNALENWFAKMGLPVDWITQVELEGDRGNIRDLNPQALTGARV